MEPEKIFICVNEYKYIIHSFLKAVDVCFKIHMALNVEYNFESQHIWEFVQIYLYSIHTEFDKKFKSVLNLISQLKYSKNLVTD